jgi:hypothetical protein
VQTNNYRTVGRWILSTRVAGGTGLDVDCPQGVISGHQRLPDERPLLAHKRTPRDRPPHLFQILVATCEPISPPGAVDGFPRAPGPSLRRRHADHLSPGFDPGNGLASVGEFSWNSTDDGVTLSYSYDDDLNLSQGARYDRICPHSKLCAR